MVDCTCTCIYSTTAGILRSTRRHRISSIEYGSWVERLQTAVPFRFERRDETFRKTHNKNLFYKKQYIATMADNKLRCVVVLRLESSGSTMIAKYDHAGKTETSSGSKLYGDRDKDFATAIQEAVAKDPPGSGGNGFGGFKVVQSDIHQLVYGSDESGICE